MGLGIERQGFPGVRQQQRPIPPDDRRNILMSEMNNPAIEPVAKKYAELRYQLMPYTYTLACGGAQQRHAADAGHVAALSG